MSAFRVDILYGAGGFHLWNHPGTPVDVTTFPLISWSSGEILWWSDDCFKKCIYCPQVPAVTQSTSHPSVSINSTTTESPESQFQQEIPQEYWAFQDVFNKQLATKLPPHWPWDLLLGATLPRGKIYPLSTPKQRTMEEYIKEPLNQGFICPSTSTTSSSFFFVAKKDGGLWPYIDHRALDSQKVKYLVKGS